MRSAGRRTRTRSEEVETSQIQEMEYRSLRTRNRPSYVIPDSDEDEKILKKNNKTERNTKKRNEKDDDVEEDEPSYPLRNLRATRGGHDSLSKVVHRPSERRHQFKTDDYSQSPQRSSSNLKSELSNKKYSFRNRDRHQRTQLNVSHLGGDGQSYEVQDSESESSSTEGVSSSRNGNTNENENENEVAEEEEDDDEEDEDDDEEDEDDEFPTKKYSFRDRSRHRRETLNVTHLGGDGQSYIKKNTRPHSTATSHSPYTVPRLYIGGKMPVPNRNERRSHSSSKRPHYARRSHFDSSSESSSDSSNGRDRKRYRNHSDRYSHDEERHFHEHEQDRLRAEMASIVPLSLDQSGTRTINGMGGSVKDQISKRDLSRADVNPIAIDSSIRFASVGGLDSHVRALKEMVVLPLLYPEVFQRFDTQPPRGVLFVGPPGTGKTLTARALANSLSTTGGASSGSVGGRKVSFFMRKGADCLSKWVGEGERQLRLLFEQAKRYEPSIIFFDEIDGLAPVRSIKQDQIHASIVSTLLALMDGLDSRGQVVVIGATNRPDAIDPALRRPGRFDRELVFPLPDVEARRAILKIHTASWQPPLDSSLVDWIVQSTSGYCGADVKALCSEAAIISLRRAYPQVYQSNQRLDIDPMAIRITRGDFAAALSRVIPASRRAASTAPSRSLDTIAKPLLNRHIQLILSRVKQIYALADSTMLISPGVADGVPTPDFGKGFDEEWIAALTDVHDQNLAEEGNSPVYWDSTPATSRSRILISGARGMSHTDIAGVVLQHLESFQVFNLDINAILSDGAYYSPEQALISRIFEARKAAPCIIYFPDIAGWCKVANDSLKTILLSLLDSFPVTLPILWISTFIWDEEDPTSNDCEISDEKFIHLVNWLSGVTSRSRSPTLLTELANQISACRNVISLTVPTQDERFEFFNQYFSSLSKIPRSFYEARRTFFEARNQKLTFSVIPSNEVRTSNGVQTPLESNSSDNERNENYLREQRLFFWTALSELKREKKFASLVRPVDPEQVADYYDVITAPMDLETMRSKVDADLYPTLKCFLYDIEQIIFNAKEYNPLNSRDIRGRSIVSAAHHMLDVVKTHAYAFKERLGYDVFKRCEEVYFRKHGSFPTLNEDRSVMPEENKIYYKEIFDWHRQLKKEFEEDQNKIHTEEPEDMQRREIESSPRQTRKSKTQELDQSLDSSEILESCDERALRKRARSMKAHRAVIENRDTTTTTLNELSIETAVVSEATTVSDGPLEPLVFELPQYDIEQCRLAMAYKSAIPQCDKLNGEGYFQKLLVQTVNLTNDWCISDLITFYTELKRFTREFQLHGDWNKLIHDLETAVNP